MRARGGASPGKISDSRGTSSIRGTRIARAASSRPDPGGRPPRRSLERALEVPVAGTRPGRAGLRRGRSEGARDEGRGTRQGARVLLPALERGHVPPGEHPGAEVPLTSAPTREASAHPPNRGHGIIHDMTVFHWCCPTCSKRTRSTNILVINGQFSIN